MRLCLLDCEGNPLGWNFERVQRVSYLGIDLGTSGLRALLLDGDGNPIGSVARTYETTHPHIGWSEQDPQLWIDALESAVLELSASYSGFADLSGIGVSGHMHGAVALDSNARVIRPAILWNDTRSHAEAAALDDTPKFRTLSGNIVFPGFTAPKLVWMQHNEPESFAQIAKVLLPTAFVNHYLTGAFASDMSDASGTSWLDVGARDWSDTLLRLSGMEAAQMPTLAEGSDPIGILRPALTAKWGVTGTPIVAAGAGDNAASACGIGALTQGQGFVSLGTSGVVLAARDGFHPNPDTAIHTFCHAVPDRWYQMGVMLAATDSLNWLGRITGLSPADLTQELGSDISQTTPTRFLPYISGERTPHNDADIRGAFTGLGAQTIRADMTRAVLEGVSFGLKESAEALKATGAQLDQMFIVGGGAASDYWVSMLATVLDMPLSVPDNQECGAAMGAARLAICAATGTAVEDVMTQPIPSAKIDPNQAQKARFEDRYQGFKSAYEHIKQAQ